MAGTYKSKYTGEQIDELLDILAEKKDIITNLSVTDEGDLMYDGNKIKFDVVEEETTETVSE